MEPATPAIHRTTITKDFTPLPFAHRLHLHPGHCRHLHGHNWALSVTISADAPDECGFVADFGGDVMHRMRDYWRTFDHALVLAEADPFAQIVQATIETALTDPTRADNMAALDAFGTLKVLPAVTCEALAEHFRVVFQAMLDEDTARVLTVEAVTVREADTSTATVQRVEHSSAPVVITTTRNLYVNNGAAAQVAQLSHVSAVAARPRTEGPQGAQAATPSPTDPAAAPQDPTAPVMVAPGGVPDGLGHNLRPVLNFEPPKDAEV